MKCNADKLVDQCCVSYVAKFIPSLNAKVKMDVILGSRSVDKSVCFNLSTNKRDINTQALICVSGENQVSAQSE